MNSSFIIACGNRISARRAVPCLALLVLFGSGCGLSVPKGINAETNSPYDVVEAMNQALGNEEMIEVFKHYTPESRDLAIAVSMMHIYRICERSKYLVSFGAVLGRHGIDTEKFTNFAYHWVESDIEGPTQFVSRLSDPMAFFQDLDSLAKSIEQSQPSTYDHPSDVILEDLTIEGDRAAGWVHRKYGSSDDRSRVYFRRIQDRWYVDLKAQIEDDELGQTNGAERPTPPQASQGNDSPAVNIRFGMTVAEVERLLGKGEPTNAPEGRGMPLGMWTTVDGESKYLACTFFRFGHKGKSVVIAFLDGRVTEMFDGRPAMVEVDR
ncbi:MAG TPA: hypothetical protein PKD64_13230 [Pirellulaceae bacterium]|nr:hypothetical protein [Pirellulaceae bacterium]HMO93149.1 hypothetical protein [Pirellulaceae bacterium]HMP70021.1 hypothetical protein [Pirellulaceae bacterium]